MENKDQQNEQNNANLQNQAALAASLAAAYGQYPQQAQGYGAMYDQSNNSATAAALAASGINPYAFSSAYGNGALQTNPYSALAMSGNASPYHQPSKDMVKPPYSYIALIAMAIQ